MAARMSVPDALTVALSFERTEKRRKTKLAKRQLWLGWPAQRPLRTEKEGIKAVF